MATDGAAYAVPVGSRWVAFFSSFAVALPRSRDEAISVRGGGPGRGRRGQEGDGAEVVQQLCVARSGQDRPTRAR